MTTTSPNTPAQELIERLNWLLGTMRFGNISAIKDARDLLLSNSIELERYRETLEYYAREIGDHGKRARATLKDKE
jgi:hypothetical protein